MNQWVDAIGLTVKPRIGTSEFLDAHDDLPDWISFLLWAGWWMRSNARPEWRLHLVALLPARNCCAAITAIGACLASTHDFVDDLTFQEFETLPEGTRVSLRDQGRMFEGVLGSSEWRDGHLFRKVALATSLRRWKNSTYFVSKSNLNKYQVSTDRRTNLSPQRQAGLERAERFYCTLDARARPGWSLSARREVLLVTSKAAWWRDIENVCGQTQDDETSLVVPLAELVVPTEEQHGFPGKTLLSSPSAVMNDAECTAVAILDGPDAIRTAEEVNADAVLMLIEHSECDETAIQEIAALADAREKRRSARRHP